MIMAAGSNDRTLSVWASELSLPLLHVTQLHGGPVIDVAWGPDGYTLYAASSDDSVSVIR
jgi:WD40 repeat protein